MRSVELAKVALASEGLRLRRMARRQALRVAYGAGAAVFGIAMLVVLHFVIYLLLLKLVLMLKLQNSFSQRMCLLRVVT